MYMCILLFPLFAFSFVALSFSTLILLIGSHHQGHPRSLLAMGFKFNRQHSATIY